MLWCALRDEQHSANDADTICNQKLITVAKMKADILAGLIDKSLNTSWYARKDDVESNEEKCPHPNNAENLKRIELFQAQLKRFQ